LRDPPVQNLLGLDAAGLQAFVAALGEKPFRGRQLLRWIHRRGASDFEAMSDLARSLRARLAQTAGVQALPVISDSTSADGTRKWLLDVGHGNAIETVFIPEEDRGTLCVSSQAGCAMNCLFCSTGRQGFNRNLTTAEIIGQLWWAEHALRAQLGITAEHERVISNVVLMGMGEPLQNLDALLPALRLMLDDNAYGLSRRRVTVSTSGVVPGMDQLRDECPVALAVSLHAPRDALRDQLVPVNRKYPLRALLAACNRYLERAPRDFVTFEYVMLDGVNDSDADAYRLLDHIKRHKIPAKINLIPFNPFPGSPYRRSPQPRIDRFRESLMRAGYICVTRTPRGDDIDAACGQLVGKVHDRSRRQLRRIPIVQEYRP